MGDKRNYSADQVKALQGSIKIEHTLAKIGAKQLRNLFENEDYVNTFGAYNGQQAVQHVKAGLKAIYVSGWQVAAAANSNEEVYPDQSLYSVDSVPNAVRNINNAFRRQDQIQVQDGREGFYYAPIVADAEAGFGGALNAYELARNLIEAGALFAKDSTNVFDFPLIQAVVNINKQHLNFVKKKTISEKNKRRDFVFKEVVKIVPIITPTTTKIP